MISLLIQFFLLLVGVYIFCAVVYIVGAIIAIGIQYLVDSFNEGRR